MRNARRSADISQAAVAEALGMTTSYISDVESDKRFPPKSAAIIKWARMVGVDPAVALHISGRPYEVYGGVDTMRDIIASDEERRRILSPAESAVKAQEIIDSLKRGP